MSLIGAIILALFAGLVWFLLVSSRAPDDRSQRICKLFGLDPYEFELIGSDLGDAEEKVFLRGDELVGVPDAIFRKRSDQSIVIGEVKSRKHRNKIYDDEHYQVVLYIGVAKSVYCRPAIGILRFGCGSCVPVNDEPDLYDSLRRRIPELRQILGTFNR